ncbi:MAG: sigma-54-dependent Fis family transcriptional regulator [Calditrichaeota bacterium]|nr:sigma-54-dependent Fis family transcriptional regulator [Calditrichota bacterium]
MRILVVDDDKNICDSLSWILKQEGHIVSTCSSGEAALKTTENEPFDVAFMDLMMPGMGGLNALPKILTTQPQLKIFMISGQADISTAVRATKLGAYDFLEKPLNPEKVILEIKKIREQQNAKSEIIQLKKLVDLNYQMIGDSLPMQHLRDIIQQAAPSEGRILIYGENGTGKELVAREIHKKSNRSKGPFVQLNCAAIPGELIESELFGYEKGAFTGAHRKKQGLFEQAEDGTLLLDEIGDMALETQAKLLRVLQENEFYRVGSTSPQKFDIRIISATNKDLLQEIEKGNFRQDLYFRLNVIPIRVPTLREHAQDIPQLVRHFLTAYSMKNGKKQKTMTRDAELLLQQYQWPGNIRELKNILERLAIMTKTEKISRHDVEMVLGTPEPAETKEMNSLSTDDSLPLKEQITHFEKILLEKAYMKYHGNVTHIAAALETDRANLHKKLKKYGIKT